MNTKVKQSKHLTEGATLLMETIKTPAKLLNFLVESLWWMDEFRIENKEVPESFEPRIIIEHIVQPWFAGGENVKEKIAEGIHNVRDCIGAEGYREYISKMVQAFGLNIKTGIYNNVDKFLQPMSTMIKLSLMIDAYELELFKKNNISKAA